MLDREHGVSAKFAGDWIYDACGDFVPSRPKSADQGPALLASIVRTLPHPSSPNGQSAAPADVAAQRIAVKRAS